MPIQASILKPRKWPMRVPSSTAEVAATSERESVAVAAMAAEPMRRERERLKKLIQSFTRMDAARIPTVSQEKETVSG